MTAENCFQPVEFVDSVVLLLFRRRCELCRWCRPLLPYMPFYDKLTVHSIVYRMSVLLRDSEFGWLACQKPKNPRLYLPYSTDLWLFWNRTNVFFFHFSVDLIILCCLNKLKIGLLTRIGGTGYIEINRQRSMQLTNTTHRNYIQEHTSFIIRHRFKTFIWRNSMICFCFCLACWSLWIALLQNKPYRTYIVERYWNIQVYGTKSKHHSQQCMWRKWRTLLVAWWIEWMKE